MRPETLDWDWLVENIKVNGCKIELGSYETREAARDAYRDAADRFFGEFAEMNRG
jgi:hypothetical protein